MNIRPERTFTCRPRNPEPLQDPVIVETIYLTAALCTVVMTGFWYQDRRASQLNASRPPTSSSPWKGAALSMLFLSLGAFSHLHFSGRMEDLKVAQIFQHIRKAQQNSDIVGWRQGVAKLQRDYPHRLESELAKAEIQHQVDGVKTANQANELLGRYYRAAVKLSGHSILRDQALDAYLSVAQSYRNLVSPQLLATHWVPIRDRVETTGYTLSAACYSDFVAASQVVHKYLLQLRVPPSHADPNNALPASDEVYTEVQATFDALTRRSFLRASQAGRRIVAAEYDVMCMESLQRTIEESRIDSFSERAKKMRVYATYRAYAAGDKDLDHPRKFIPHEFFGTAKEDN